MADDPDLVLRGNRNGTVGAAVIDDYNLCYGIILFSQGSDTARNMFFRVITGDIHRDRMGAGHGGGVIQHDFSRFRWLHFWCAAAR